MQLHNINMQNIPEILKKVNSFFFCYFLTIITIVIDFVVSDAELPDSLCMYRKDIYRTLFQKSV